MRPARVRERVGAADADVELSGGDPPEELVGPREEFVAGPRVGAEAGAGQEQGPQRVEALDVEGRHLAAGAAEQRHQPARAQRRQARLERVLADAVVDDVDPPATREVPRPGGCLGVTHDLVGPGGPRQLGLGRGGDGREDVGAPALEHLGEQQPDPAGRRVHQRPRAGAHRERVRREVVRGEPLEQDGRGHLRVEAVGDGHQFPGRDEDLLGVAAGRLLPGDGLPDGEPLDPGSQRRDPTGALAAEHRGQLEGVDPAAAVGVDEVHAGHRHVDEHLTRSRHGLGEVDEGEDLRPSGPLRLDCAHGAACQPAAPTSSLSRRCSPAPPGAR